MSMTNRSCGFTILELSFVLIIFGIVVVTVMSAFGLYNKQKVDMDTENSMNTVRLALLDYRDRYKAYPCPADPTRSPTDPLYGRAERASAWPDLSGACTSGTLTATPGIDTDADADAAGDPVLVGAVPIATLMDPDGNPVTDDSVLRGDPSVLKGGLNFTSSLDGWNRKLTYAVSAYLTNTNTYNDFYGAIDVRDEYDQSILVPGRFAHFVIVSHGEDGRGAYTSTGGGPVGLGCGLGVPAAIPPAVSTSLNETENCDDDAIFLSGLRNDNDHSFNDDKVLIGYTEQSNLWAYGQETDDGIAQIVNTNSGSVGIGTTTPKEKLHVVGDVQATQIDAQKYCDLTGTEDCMPPSTIGGDGTNNAAMQCPPGKVIVSVGLNSATCTDPFPDEIKGETCPVIGGKQWVVKGVQSSVGPNGHLLCCDPSAAVGSPDAC